ncbi:hypothetical protein ACIRL0_17055 [Streptomyces sp. NPDC102365]|uniref:hypothetical protein n=1 Tax=Streptomyces sp. NPDC102365 TaxID=3366162 RepID=UPI00381C5620
MFQQGHGSGGPPVRDEVVGVAEARDDVAAQALSGEGRDDGGRAPDSEPRAASGVLLFEYEGRSLVAGTP